MTFYTVTEFNTMKLYELDNVTYNKIHDRFANFFGDKMAKTFLEKHLGMEIKKFSANSFVNIMDCFTIL